MNAQRALRQNDGWGMVFMVALLGLAVAALVVLTPWHIRDLPGGDRPSSSSRDTVVEVQSPQGAWVSPPEATGDDPAVQWRATVQGVGLQTTPRELAPVQLESQVNR